MKKILFVFILALIGFSGMMASNLFAACSSTTCYGKIHRIYYHSSGVLYIETDGDESVLGCTSPSGAYVTLPSDDPNFNRKYAMLLTAISQQMPIGLRIYTGSPTCEIAYLYLDD
ncbi:hypothetical protein [Desulfogranum marinum]|uniref:hypothetical protein n=1 Tax=Desulfogranum marinum TaxID=453220 RepID=UPI0019631855|nr:hypothetical protein [Desulfogranum marinum]MBM9513712.1 hypothetical protein [Desulfogranum marinum]